MEKSIEAPKRNNSIDIFRILCAFMVVAIHTHPFYDVNETLGFIASELLTRIAVPFFFCVSGYFYIKGIISGKKLFKKTFLNILKQYVFWSIIYFAIQLLHTIKNGDSFLGFIKDCVLKFFVLGSYSHLWFIPALLFAVTVATLFGKLGNRGVAALVWMSVGLYIIGVLVCAYGNVLSSVPLLDKIISFEYFTTFRRVVLMGLPFFSLGYFILKLEKQISKNKSIIFIAIFFLIYLAENIVIRAFQLCKNNVLTFALYPLVIFVFVFLIKTPLTKLSKLSMWSKYCADFIYFSHYIFIILFSYLFADLPETLTFILVLLTATAAATAVYFIKRMIKNKKTKDAV